MFNVGTIIKCKNHKFEIVAINNNHENPYFKYELACVDNKNSNNHPYFMGDDDIEKYNIEILTK